MAAMTRDASSAHQNESTVKLVRASAENQSTAALRKSESRKPKTSVSGSRSAAKMGGITAFSAAMTTATTNAPPQSSMSTPGRIAAVKPSESAARIQEMISCSGRSRSFSGCHWLRSSVVVTLLLLPAQP